VGVGTVSTITITFSEPMQPGTVTVQATSGPCTGSVHILEGPDFTTCIGAARTTADDVVFTFTPAESLANEQLYKVVVTADALAADWVLHPNTHYVNAEGKYVLRTDANGIFDFSSGGGENDLGSELNFWDGLSNDWTNRSPSCEDWTSTTGEGAVGFDVGLTSQWLIGGELPCSSARPFVCAEQRSRRNGSDESPGREPGLAHAHFGPSRRAHPNSTATLPLGSALMESQTESHSTILVGLASSSKRQPPAPHFAS